MISERAGTFGLVIGAIDIAHSVMDIVSRGADPLSTSGTEAGGTILHAVLALVLGTFVGMIIFDVILPRYQDPRD